MYTITIYTTSLRIISVQNSCEYLGNRSSTLLCWNHQIQYFDSLISEFVFVLETLMTTKLELVSFVTETSQYFGWLFLLRLIRVCVKYFTV